MNMQHRHFTAIARVIANLNLPDEQREHVAEEFAKELRYTNTAFSHDRFMSAAMGQPINGRDR